MAKAKGEKFECKECGLVVVVEEACGCDDCAIICCDMEMEKMPKKTTKKAPAKKTAAKPKKAAKKAPAKKK